MPHRQHHHHMFFQHYAILMMHVGLEIVDNTMPFFMNIGLEIIVR